MDEKFRAKAAKARALVNSASRTLYKRREALRNLQDKCEHEFLNFYDSCRICGKENPCEVEE